MKTLLFTLILFAYSLQACSTKEIEPQEFEIAVVETSFGKMYFWLFDETPNHKAKFIELANQKVYNEYTFNRVIRNFVIQGGCPDSTKYFENSPYLLDPEFVDSIGHSYGALGMGRDDNPKKRSNACQFYIVNKEQGLPQLNGDYMIFGKIIKGADVLENIEKVPTDGKDTPLTAIALDVSIERYTKEQLASQFNFMVPD